VTPVAEIYILYCFRIPHLSHNKEFINAPPKPSKIYQDNCQAPFREFLRSFKETPLEECATKIMTNQFNVFQLYLKDARKLISNLGGFLAAKYIKHNK
jgi:hypothetical protein